MGGFCDEQQDATVMKGEDFAKIGIDFYSVLLFGLHTRIMFLEEVLPLRLMHTTVNFSRKLIIFTNEFEFLCNFPLVRL